MLKNIIYSFILILLFNYNTFGQGESLVNVFDIDGSYENKEFFVLPSYKLKIDSDFKLFYKDSLVFTPKDEFMYSTYHVFNDRFLIITGHTEKGYKNNLKNILPKNNIVIIDTESWDKLHYVKLDNMFILDIFVYGDNNSIALRAVKPENVEIFDLENN